MSLVPGIDDAFWPPFVHDVLSTGRDPKNLASLMMSESDFSPTAINWTKDASGNKVPVAVGINQLTAASGMFQPWSNEAALAFAQLSASEQWRTKSGPYFMNQLRAHPQAESPRDLYWLNFLPATYKPGMPDDYLIPDSEKYAQWNPIFRDPATGLVKVGLMQKAIDGAIARNKTKWALIQQAIDRAMSPLEAAQMLARRELHALPGLGADKQKRALLAGGVALGVLAALAGVYRVIFGGWPWLR